MLVQWVNASAEHTHGTYVAFHGAQPAAGLREN